MALSVDDILIDLAQLHPQQSSSPSLTLTTNNATHPLLSLGKTLLPPTLQTNIQQESHRSSTTPTVAAPLTQLEEALSQVDGSHTSESQQGALLLSSIYLDNTRNVLSLNQERDELDPWEADQGKEATNSLFDDLHRKVAKLQSSNEGYMARLQELRDLVVADKGNTSTGQVGSDMK
jgi:hypothetical protein